MVYGLLLFYPHYPNSTGLSFFPIPMAIGVAYCIFNHFQTYSSYRFLDYISPCTRSLPKKILIRKHHQFQLLNITVGNIRFFSDKTHGPCLPRRASCWFHRRTNLGHNDLPVFQRTEGSPSPGAPVMGPRSVGESYENGGPSPCKGPWCHSMEEKLQTCSSSAWYPLHS